MSGSVKLPRGVKRLDNGRVRVRVQRTLGSSAIVSATYDTEFEAIAAHHRATQALAAGGDVAAALARHALSAGDQQSVSIQVPVPRRERTFAELTEEFTADRQELVELSDHRKRSRGKRSLRPTTHKATCQVIEKELVPQFGNLPISEITFDEVDSWLRRRAAKGHAPSTVDQNLILLRQIVATAKRSEIPDDFPWRRAAAIEPARRLRQQADPERWGGTPGSRAPMTSFAEMYRLAQHLMPSDRIVMYLEGFGGPRSGETFGLRPNEISVVENRVWIRIWRQVDSDNVEIEWVKTDAGYRRIPLPNTLGRYVREYLKLYHDYDLDNPDPAKGYRRLVVNPAGRDVDGSFLPAHRSNYAVRYTTTRCGVGFSIDDLGYALTQHHLRASCSTYLLNSRDITVLLTGGSFAPLTGNESADELRARIAALEASQPRFSPKDVSAFLGHAHDGKGDDQPANPVTLKHYNLRVHNNTPFEAIADFLDRVIQHEIGNLPLDVSDRDTMPSHPIDDHEWITAAAASELLGITQPNVSVAVHRGALDGHLGWLRDGGWLTGKGTPTKPLMFVSRTSVEQFRAERCAPCLKDVMRALGMSERAVKHNFVETAVIRLDRTPRRALVNVEDTANLLRIIEEGILGAFPQSAGITARTLASRFNETHGTVFREGRATERWVRHWLTALLAARRVTARLDKTYSLPPSDDRQARTLAAIASPSGLLV